ncbi:MAG TPA: aminotransferase class V-fold PLP-dependent enzyme [Fastidiosipila sp.]|nr:aminotransferase class V-fold PLP-dependent enzyme [Fastidiosipila sp.]
MTHPYDAFDIDPSVLQLADEAEAASLPVFEDIDRVRRHWQLKTIKAFQDVGVSESAYQMTTGYGYADRAREQTEALFADIFDAEEAIVRVQFSSGTHVLAAMLRGLLQPGDHLLIASGMPYDTILPLLGLSGQYKRTLKDLSVEIDIVPLSADGTMDVARVEKAIKENTALVYVQKSRGYTARPAIDNGQIRELRARIGKTLPIAVDFCYSEYVEWNSPLRAGANLIAGSLIKNPGAGIAPTGGYIAGDRALLEAIADDMTAPGVGAHIGPQLGLSRALQQGLYFAPRVVAEALKSAVFTAALFSAAGYLVSPLPTDPRADIVQSVVLNSRERLIAFCEAVQKTAPIDSYVTPVPAPMPGYDCDIIMASGAFIAGSSIELSADGPLRPPFTAFMQGALAYENGRLAAMMALSNLK